MKLQKVALLFFMPFVAGCAKTPEQPVSVETLFQNAITEAMKIDRANIRPLVTVTTEDSNILWNNTKDKVLMVTCHNYPDSYKEGETIQITWGDSWVTSAKEMSNFYKNNEQSFATDAYLRTKQLVGLRYDSKNEWLSAYWVSPTQLKRPAYVTDITKQMDIAFPSDTTKEYKNWFYSQCGWSYYSEKQAPWTRLGYTYDWVGNKDRYGLTEFLIQEGSITVEKTAKIPDFLNYLKTI